MFLKLASLVLLFEAFINNAYACTTFASAQGENHSVIIAKNRDEHPGFQSIVAFHPDHGYRFVALVSQQDLKSPYVIRSGTNEFELTIVNMAAGYVLKGYPNFNPNRYNDGDDFMRNVLTQYRSIDEVVKHLPAIVQHSPYPEFYLLADHEKTALIEVAPNAQYAVTLSNTLPIYHANHYINPLFSSYNINDDQSSLNRYNRIADLMQTHTNYSIATFINFAHDHHSGDSDSIFRIDQNPTAPRTLATYIAQIPKNQHRATIYIQFYPKPISDGPAYQFHLNRKFWAFSAKQKILVTESLPASITTDQLNEGANS